MMKFFKVSKYPRAGYDSWMAISDIGDKAPDDSEVLTEEEYLRVEDLYCKYVLIFFEELVQGNFSITYIEYNKEVNFSEYAVAESKLGQLGRDFKLGDVVDELSLELAVRMNLRELIYTVLKSSNGCELFFGYDFYMYVGVTDDLIDAVNNIYVEGLYVEVLDYDPRE